jgi:curved DNA-binding protein
MEYKDYYHILGLSREAGEKDIKRAFRRLAREHHPDVNPGNPQAEERFKEINEAHEVLSDPEKRRKYDQLGATWRDWERTGRQPDDFDWSRWAASAPGGQRVHVRYGTAEDLEDLFGGSSPFSDFFSQIFGGTAGATGGFQVQTRARRGQDLQQDIEVSLEEAYQGTTRLLQKNGRRLQVRIPPGAANCTRVRMAGEGAPGRGDSEPGDLYLQVHVAPHPSFERRGDDLYVTVPVDLCTAVLGGTVRVDTMSGPVTLTIPPGTQNSQSIRLAGKGMPRLRQPEQHGDVYVGVEVRLPTHLTDRERELFQQLRRLSQERS